MQQGVSLSRRLFFCPHNKKEQADLHRPARFDSSFPLFLNSASQGYTILAESLQPLELLKGRYRLRTTAIGAFLCLCRAVASRTSLPSGFWFSAGRGFGRTEAT